MKLTALAPKMVSMARSLPVGPANLWLLARESIPADFCARKISPILALDWFHEPRSAAEPVALRLTEGGTARRNIVSHRPMPPSVEYSPLAEPADIRPLAPLDAAAEQFWHTTIVPLIELGVVTAIDAAAATMLCQAWSRLQTAERVLATEGVVSRGSMGQARPHPALTVANSASALTLKLAREFGLTPAARTRLGLQNAARQTLQSELRERLVWNPRRTDPP
jgi:P27 family predicted phage terminase small subunit